MVIRGLINPCVGRNVRFIVTMIMIIVLAKLGANL